MRAAFSNFPLTILHFFPEHTVQTDEGEDKTVLKQYDFFGSEVLPAGERKYEATVISTTTMNCWKLDRTSIERTLDKLRTIRRASKVLLVNQPSS